MLALLNPMKDKVISSAIKKVLNAKFAMLGEVLDVHLNSSRKILTAQLFLKGEEAPLDIHLENYRIFQDGDRCLLNVEKIRTSKEWLNHLFDMHLKKQQMVLPGHLASLIRMLT